METGDGLCCEETLCAQWVGEECARIERRGRDLGHFNSSCRVVGNK